jgi:hypothetical protein
MTLATGAALALTTLGVTPASAGEGPAPKPGPWTTISETTVFPKGTACKAKVVAKEKFTFRETQLKDGKVLVEYKNSSWSKFTNPKKHKSYKIGSGGDLLIKPNKDGSTLYIKGQGENYGQGLGVYGIVYSKGPISFKVVNADDPAKTRIVDLDLNRAKKVVQICYKIGTKPVWGQNILPEQGS